MNERTVRSIPGAPYAEPAPPTGWEAFEKALASALSVLKDEILILSARTGTRYVQFHASPDEEVFAEAVSNAYLGAAEKLDVGQLATLLSLGWSAPTRAPGAPPPAATPRGSPNHFRPFPHPFSCAEIASFAVRTLTEALRVENPSDLQYRAFDDDGNPVTLPVLHIAQEPPPARKERSPAKASGHRPFARLRSRVLDAARKGSGLGALGYEDGSLQVPIGNRTGWVRPCENPFFVRVHVHLLSDVEGDAPFLARVHEMNARFPMARVIYSGRSVFLGVDFPAVPFRAEHLTQAIATVARLGDEVVAELRSPEAQPPVAN